MKENSGWKNVTPITQRDPEERLEMCRKGAAAAREKRKRAKTFREAAKWVMGLDSFKSDNPDIAELTEAISGKYEGFNNAEAMSIAQTVMAMKGDTKAFTALRDTAGELPTQAVDCGFRVVFHALECHPSGMCAKRGRDVRVRLHWPGPQYRRRLAMA